MYPRIKYTRDPTLAIRPNLVIAVFILEILSTSIEASRSSSRLRGALRVLRKSPNHQLQTLLSNVRKLSFSRSKSFPKIEPYVNDGHPYPLPPFDWDRIENIPVSGGDVIVCQHKRYLESRRTYWFMAINGYELFYVHPTKALPSTNIGLIGAERKVGIGEAHKSINTNKCKNLGDAGYDRAKVLTEAMNWNEKLVFYDPDSCSSYHWVMYWVTGEPPLPRTSSLAGFDKPLHSWCRLRTVLKDPRSHRCYYKHQIEHFNVRWTPTGRKFEWREDTPTP